MSQFKSQLDLDDKVNTIKTLSNVNLIQRLADSYAQFQDRTRRLEKGAHDYFEDYTIYASELLRRLEDLMVIKERRNDK